MPQIEPPNPSVAVSGEVRRRGLGYLATTLIWFGILLAITLVAWVVLWSGGIREAAPADAAHPAGQRS
jgi:hypothetical protein